MAIDKEPMLFGHPKYEVESLADTIQRARESESTKPELYEAAMKLLRRRQTALSMILSARRKKKD